jgi:hypothetical protein
VQIIATEDVRPAGLSNFAPGERLGNISRESASALADLMDFPSVLLDECNVYDIGFRFVCVLSEKLHHKGEGYLITILVYSINSDMWTDKMFDILLAKKF